MIKYKKLILNVGAILLAAVFLFPIYWIVINSLKTDAEIFQFPPSFFPGTSHLTLT